MYDDDAARIRSGTTQEMIATMSYVISAVHVITDVAGILHCYEGVLIRPWSS